MKIIRSHAERMAKQDTPGCEPVSPTLYQRPSVQNKRREQGRYISLTSDKTIATNSRYLPTYLLTNLYSTFPK